MKKLILGTLMAAAISANAQEQASTTTATATAPAAGTSSLDTKAEATPLFQLNLSSENYTGLRDQNEFGTKAPVVSLDAVGVIYTGLPNKMKIELRQYMEYASNKENLTGTSADLHKNDWEMSYTMLRIAGALDNLGAAIGSKPIAIEGRYYAPTDRLSVDGKRNGILRMDMVGDWNLTPTWEVLGVVSPRILLNSEQNPDAAVGSDAQYYRMVAGVYGAYNFNDKVQAYYGFSQDLRSKNAQRGHWAADGGNVAIHEIGLNWTVGAITINPVFESDLDQTGADASIFTNGSRYYADDTTAANLNFYATF